MNKQTIKDILGWGFLLWLIGYALGIILFTIVPASMIGLIITPIGIVIILWVLFKKITSGSLKYFAILSVAWTLMAIICDYFFLVKAFNPSDGYYKFDVYLYYALTFSLPLIVGWYRTKSKGPASVA